MDCVESVKTQVIVVVPLPLAVAWPVAESMATILGSALPQETVPVFMALDGVVSQVNFT